MAKDSGSRGPAAVIMMMYTGSVPDLVGSTAVVPHSASTNK